MLIRLFNQRLSDELAQNLNKSCHFIVKKYDESSVFIAGIIGEELKASFLKFHTQANEQYAKRLTYYLRQFATFFLAKSVAIINLTFEALELSQIAESCVISFLILSRRFTNRLFFTHFLVISRKQHLSLRRRNNPSAL